MTEHLFQPAPLLFMGMMASFLLALLFVTIAGDGKDGGGAVDSDDDS